jgi:hypothetical protein
VKTYTCDKCGAQAHDKAGIFGREFEYFGFRTLSEAYRFADVKDVCAQCFEQVQRAADGARDDAEKTKRRGFLSRLGIAT